MSKRRQIGEEVAVQYGDERFVGVIQPPEISPNGKPYEAFIPWCVYSCGDDDCVEWMTVLNPETGEFHYHVAECRMEDV